MTISESKPGYQTLIQAKINIDYQVDGEIFPVTEGSIVRVTLGGKRALKNSRQGRDCYDLYPVQG